MAFTNHETITIDTFEDGVTISQQLPFGPETSVFSIEIKDATGNNLQLPLPGGGKVSIEVSETPENFTQIERGEIGLYTAEYYRPYVSQGLVRYVRVTLYNVDPADAASMVININQTS